MANPSRGQLGWVDIYDAEEAERFPSFVDGFAGSFGFQEVSLGRLGRVFVRFLNLKANPIRGDDLRRWNDLQGKGFGAAAKITSVYFP